jgi:phosphoenolpyruvate carboxykinase (GTP)
MLDVLRDWVAGLEQHCSPRKVYWCDGSAAEKAYLSDLAVRRGILRKLNDERWPGCYHHRTHLLDSAEGDSTTYVCTNNREDAGSNLWMPPAELSQQLHRNLRGALRGRTMYVIPFLMGPPGSASARVGVQVTDSLYLTLCMLNLETVGTPAYQHLQSAPYFVRSIHSSLDLDPDRRVVAQFPQDKLVISIGSNFSANALLAKKSVTLMLASRLAADEGWLVGHVAVFGIENPAGEKHYFAAVLPCGFGKGALSMLTPPPAFPDWKLTTLSSCAAWLRLGPDGHLYAINPRAGYYGPLPGNNLLTQPNVAETLRHDCIFTNCGTTPEGDLWWEGMGKPPPESLSDWSGNPWRPNSPVAHPNSRFCAPATNNPSLDQAHLAPEGVPISAILFCGLRQSVYPPLVEARDWRHGVFLGATLSSESVGACISKIRYDPFAMSTFVGYPLEHYLRSWLDLGTQLTRPPKIFHVNWFWRSNQYLGSAFAENFWILHWIFRRCSGTATVKEHRLGLVPELEGAASSGLTGSELTAFERLLQSNANEWQHETENQAGYLQNIMSLPEISYQWTALRERFGL